MPIARDRWGRPLLVPPDGGKPQPHRRPTTVAKAISDTSNLARWQQRMVAIGLAERPDLLALVSTRRDDRKAMDDLCEQALSAAKADAAAQMGTALHEMTQMVDLGLLAIDRAPEAQRGKLAAYRRALDAHGIEILREHIERMVVWDEPRLAGTPDRIARHDGELVIADLKTGRTVDFGSLEWMLQLTIYAHADAQVDDDGDRTPMPTVSRERGLIIHLPAEAADDVCTVWEIDLRDGKATLDLAFAVEAARKRSVLTRIDARPDTATVAVLDALPGSEVVVAPDETERTRLRVVRLVEAGRGADVRAALTAVGAERVSACTTEQELRLRVLLDRIEADAGLPFDHADLPAPAAGPSVPAQPRPERPVVVASTPPTPGQLAVLEQIAATLDGEARARVGAWIGEASAAGTPIGRITPDTEHRVARATAAARLALVSADDDIARGVIATVIGADAVQTHPVGALLGSLTIAEAQRLADVAAAISAGDAHLRFALDGAVVVELAA